MNPLTQQNSEFELIAGPIELPGRDPVFMVELSARAPARTLVSIIVDMSSPYRETERQLSCLQKLVGGLPKKWKVLVYRLGGNSPLAEVCLSEVVEGSVDFAALAEKHIADSRIRGRFIRPCMESIANQLGKVDEEKALVFLLGDGRLSDFGQVKFLESITLIGITNEGKDFSKWQRVLPNSDIFDFQNSRLDDSIKDFGHPFYGLAKLRINGLALTEGVAFRLSAGGKHEDWHTSESHELNFARENARIVFDVPSANLADLVLEVESADCQSKRTIKVKDWDGSFSDECQTSVRSLFVESEAKNPLEVLFDVHPSDASFGEIHESWEVALALAEKRASWFDNDALQAFAAQFCVSDRKDRRSVKYDSFICFCHSKADSAIPSRIIGVGLRRHLHPAAEFDESSLNGLTPQNAFTIDYDEDSYRWIMKSRDGARYELDVYNSEIVDIKFLTADEWTTVFSGDLKC